MVRQKIEIEHICYLVFGVGRGRIYKSAAEGGSIHGV
jgi:hypothetical protein